MGISLSLDRIPWAISYNRDSLARETGVVKDRGLGRKRRHAGLIKESERRQYLGMIREIEGE